MRGLRGLESRVYHRVQGLSSIRFPLRALWILFSPLQGLRFGGLGFGVDGLCKGL